MKNKKIILLLFFLCSFYTLFSQSTQITGLITDKTGEPLIGASVVQVGTINGVATNFDGVFTLNVPIGSEIEVTYIGYNPRRITIKNDAPLKIILDTKEQSLDEVVVIGYGTAKKRDLTGSIVSVSGEDLKNIPANNVLKGLQGKVPGLVVTNNGAAGEAPDIKIRGVATTQLTTRPLYVVDGIFNDNIDYLNPADITSIEVLKDASSLAIFGVKGANGVIIVTTKKPSIGKVSVSYDGYVGTQILHDRDRVHLTNASQFTELYNESLKNMNPDAADWVPDLLGGGTDWQSLIYRPAMITNHGITISQGTEKSSSILSLGYFFQDGIEKYNSYQRFNARWAGDYQLSKIFKVGSNMTVTRFDATPIPNSGGVPLHQIAVRAIPTYSPYSPASDQNSKNIASYYTPSPSIQKDMPNPLAVLEINKGNHDSWGYRGTGNLYLDINFLKDFSFRVTGYTDIGINFGRNFYPRFDANNATSISSHKSLTNSVSRDVSEWKKYQVDYLLNYNKKIDNHRINAMAAYTAQKFTGRGFSASADTLVNDTTWYIHPDLRTLSMGSPLGKHNGDWYTAEAFISYLGRVSYSYADKYIAVASLRKDASSKFTKGVNRSAYFPSFGLGWVVSDEAFMENSKKYLDFLKLKASWGKIGNDAIGPFEQYPIINPRGMPLPINNQIVYFPTQDVYPDPNLTWEKTSEFNVGFESFGLNRRLKLDVEYYNKTTNDLLASVDEIAGGVKITRTNIGSIRNQGVEFIASWQDKIGKFTYGFSANGATLKNTVLALGNNNADIVSGRWHRTAVGHSVGAIYGYIADGVFQNQAEIDAYYPSTTILKPGDLKFRKLNNDSIISPEDRTYIGNTIPSFTYGLNVNFGYANIDLSIDMNGIYGTQIVNEKKLPGYNQFNYYTTALNRWHGEGTSNTEPILDGSRGVNFESSTNMLESGDYFRIRSIQIGYSFPTKLTKYIGISKVRMYANAQNPLTFRKNSGYTPEIGGAVLNANIDNGATYPIPSTYTFGLNVNF